MKKYVTSIIVIALLPLTALAVNVRDSANGNVIGTQSTGSTGTIQGGGNSAGGYYWWNVDFNSGIDGWVAENFLEGAVMGCTDQTATNYNANANIDDGSCNYPGTPGPGQLQGINGPVGPDNSENVTPGPNPYGAEDYFVSCNGNDSNNGRAINTPIKTLSRLKQITNWGPGVRVMFERGCTYREGAGDPDSNNDANIGIANSGSTSQPIEISAYGTGAAPVISGAIVADNWVQDTGGVWKTTIQSGLNHVRTLYVNDNLKTWAREPDTGWFRTDAGTDSMDIVDSELSNLGNLVGANVFWRTYLWSASEYPVVSQSGNQINLGPSEFGNASNTVVYKDPCPSSDPNGCYSFPDLNPSDGWGYFVQGKRQLLDQPGEWYYDKTTGDLYYYPEGGANPNNQLIEVAVTRHGAFAGWQKNNITIKNLDFAKYTDYAIRADNGKNIKILNNIIRDSRFGVVHYNDSSNTADGNIVSNNYIHDIYADGVAVYNIGSAYHTFNNNIVEDISMRPEYGADGSNWRYFAYVGKGHNVSFNKLKNIGYLGLTFNGSGTAEKNIIEDSLLVLNDGSPLTFDFANGLTIRQNIIKNVVGNIEAVAPNFVNRFPIAFGIYFGDKNIKNTTVEDNIVMGAGSAGIYVDHSLNSVGNVIRDNILFDNGDGLSMSDWSNHTTCQNYDAYCNFKPNYDDVYSGNKVYSLDPEASSIYMTRKWTINGSAYTDFGDFYGNYFYHPFRNYESSQAYSANFAGNQRVYIKTGQTANVYNQVPNPTQTNQQTSGIIGTIISSNSTSWNGKNYWNINFESGSDGWVSEEYLTRRLNNQISRERRFDPPPNHFGNSNWYYANSAFQSFFNEPPQGQAPNTWSNYVLTNTNLAADIYYNDTPTPKTYNVGTTGCNENGVPITGNQTLQPFTALVVEYGNCN